MLEVHFQSITIRFEKPGLNWSQTPCWRVSQAPCSPLQLVSSGAAFLCCVCNQIQPALALLPWPLSIPSGWPLAATVESRQREAVLSCREERGHWISCIAFSRGLDIRDIVQASMLSLIKIYFFIELTKFINTCVCLIVCTSFPHPPMHMSWYLSLKGFLHWIKRLCYVKKKLNKVYSRSGSLSMAESKHPCKLKSFLISW